ncbi:hypothetical protein SAMN02745229_02379 [Butyrivibrio fibrisolvens DSM 3071]|uniref:Transmembrane protein n=1 Tax=Butyrivibrio fibrisolvens DSM 3071 TaxID=1121131 RepID=A0A1M5ZKE0_BUTFI|nr:hypothetical protein [Butyrivibrio fibrisolvens]SHI24700.1 hypothetical protein SAMN02745229_02379 [Butyrivibrio fibrisolvens DSM 3071]
MTETFNGESNSGKRLSPRGAHFLSNWIMILFLLFIPTTIASILSNGKIVTSQGLLFAGYVISTICSIAYGLILLKISSKDDRYNVAGYCSLVVSAADIIKLILSAVASSAAKAAESSASNYVNTTYSGRMMTYSSTASTADTSLAATLAGVGVLISLVAIVAGLIGTKYEFTAHSSVLKGVDDELSENWLILWKWYIGAIIAMMCSLILVLALGMILIIGAVIVLFITNIVKIVFLYQTSKAFGEYNLRLKRERHNSRMA